MICNHVTDDSVIAINKDESRYTTAEEFFAYAILFGTNKISFQAKLLHFSGMFRIGNGICTVEGQQKLGGWKGIVL